MKTTTRESRTSMFGTAPSVVLTAPALDAGIDEWEGSL